MTAEADVTDDVKNLMGDPKRALVTTSIPIMLSNVVQTSNNIIDAFWMSSLGTAALTATNVVFPFFFIMIGIGNGIGVGASQAIARRIGGKDYEGSNRTAAQAFFMSVLIGAVMTVLLTVFAEPALNLASAGDYMQESLQYGMPIFAGSVAIILNCTLAGLLRAEGAAKRAMYLGLSTAGLNIVLDPLFIFGLDMGVAGAAWATVAAMVIADIVGLYWYFSKKDTFVRIPTKNFRFDRSLDWDILKVGIPASMEIVLISVTDLFMNAILVGIDPVSGIAVYGTGWKVINVLTIPIISIGFAFVPIAAGAYGSDDLPKLKDGYRFAVKLGLAIMLSITLLALVFAPWIAGAFSYTDHELKEPLTEFIRIMAVFMPATAFGIVSSNLFQGLGMGFRSLTCIILLNALRIPICALLAGFGVLSYIWWGLSASEIIAAAVTFAWAVLTVRSFRRGTAAPA